MSLKDQILSDLSIFFNPQDFGEEHELQKRKVFAIVDVEQAKQDSLKDCSGNYAGETTIFVRESDTQGLRLEPETAIIFDKRQYTIVSANPIDGLVELSLRQERGYYGG